MKEDALEVAFNKYADTQAELAAEIRTLITAFNGMQSKEMPERDTTSSEEIKALRAQLSDDFVNKIEGLERRVKGFLTEIPVRHQHHFDLRSKGFIIGSVILLITTAISVGLCFGYMRENSRLHENDIKFRMIRQQVPTVSTWADTTYLANPEFTKQQTEDLEAKETARNQAEAAAKQKEHVAKQARKEADSLRRK